MPTTRYEDEIGRIYHRQPHGQVDFQVGDHVVDINNKSLMYIVVSVPRDYRSMPSYRSRHIKCQRVGSVAVEVDIVDYALERDAIWDLRQEISVARSRRAHL